MLSLDDMDFLRSKFDKKECLNKIDCIRYYRILYGCGLKEAKDAVLNILKN